MSFEAITIYGSAFFITLLSFFYFQIFGYPLVNTITETLPIQTPPIYMLPIFFPYGILLGEILWLWIKRENLICSIILLIECITIGLISFIRYSLIIPFSGHAIILFFYLTHYIFNLERKYQLRIFIGLLILLITIFYKILVWMDPLTFIFGGLLGISISLIERVYNIKKKAS